MTPIGPISWFSTEARIAALYCEAVSWIGTPWSPNGNTKREVGRVTPCAPHCGVSCQNLVSAIYRAVGCCDVQVPSVPMSHARFSRGPSLLADFMRQRPEFVAIPERGPLAPGDMLGFVIGRSLHHCGIVIDPQVGRVTPCAPFLGPLFVHAADTVGVIISPVADAVWHQRLAAAWRPLLEWPECPLTPRSFHNNAKVMP